MKIGFIALALIATVSSCLANNLQVTTTRKIAGTNKNHAHFKSKRSTLDPGVRGHKVEEVFYEIKVTNRSFSAQPTLQARYILFVERQAKGSRKEDDTIERITGTAEMEAMAASASISFDSTFVELNEHTLSGNWIYKDGGRLKTTDKILGIWIKFYDGENEVGEYINPTTIKRLEWTGK